MKFKILVVLTLILVVISVWKWNIWFGNIEEAEFETPVNSINRIMLSVGEQIDSERNLSWRSDTCIKDNWVNLVMDGTIDTVKVNGVGTVVETQGGKSVFYRVGLNNLTQGAIYHYQIKNNYDKTPWYSFRMGNQSDDFSFLYLGDVQDKKTGDDEGIFQHLANKYSDVDFWAFGGDMIERPIEKYWNIWYASLEQVPCSIPFIACPGNHEYFKGIIKKIDKRWTHYFPLPQNGPENYKGRCCYWEYKNALIVTLDTDGFCNPFSIKEEYDWIKELFEATTCRWKIVIMHHPVYSLRKKCLNLTSHYVLQPLFEEYGVDLVLQGHDHGYARYNTKDKSGGAMIPVYVTSSCSKKSYTPSVFDKWDRMAAFRKMYQIINVSKDSLNYKCFDYANGLYDDITIHSSNKSITQNMVHTAELLDPSEKLINKGGDALHDYQEGAKERIKSH